MKYYMAIRNKILLHETVSTNLTYDAKRKISHKELRMLKIKKKKEILLSAVTKSFRLILL